MIADTPPAPAATRPEGRCLTHLLARLAVIEARVRGAVTTRRAVDPSPDDPFRGLYIGDHDLERLLAGTPLSVDGHADLTREADLRADECAAAGSPARVQVLAERCGLDSTDIDLLVIAMAPDLDPRFEGLYGYLHDDVSRRRASIGLALTLAGLPPMSAAARDRLSPTSRLVRPGLLDVGDVERPFLTRSLQVPDRVTAHLLGGDQPDASIVHLLVEPVAWPTTVDGALRPVLETGDALVYVHERPGTSGRSTAAAALERTGRAILSVDITRLDRADDWRAAAASVSREALLTGAGLVVGPIEHVAERTGAVRILADTPGVVILFGRDVWDPAWSDRVPVVVETSIPSAADRAGLWERSLECRVAPGVDPAAATAHFRLTPEQLRRAAVAAQRQASLTGDDRVTDRDLRAGARLQNGSVLEGRARRIEPGVSWGDLVLPPTCLASLREVVARARHRDLVLDEWAMRPGGGRGRGVTALFAGDSGTGKTMSAEVVAHALGLDLYTVDLATVVDKYIGETEKNLERIFTEAGGMNAVLLFDEADALFGKRSEVRDAHDRYANIEVAYLLQRMETFDGLAILATNLRSNLDEAFTRRIDVIADFPLPDEPHRRLLWDRCLGAAIPRGRDVDLDFCARQFELTGGNIRSIAVSAAYLAAESGRPLTMTDLIRATQREYRKLGRLLVSSEFGPWSIEQG